MIARRNQNVSNSPEFFKDKTKLLIVSKKCENWPEQKLLNQNFLVLIENVLFRSRILFQKRIYSIFFGTKAGKRKLLIFKERWFDIATWKMRPLDNVSLKKTGPLDDKSLGREASWTMRHLDDASLERRVPWMTRPWPMCPVPGPYRSTSRENEKEPFRFNHNYAATTLLTVKVATDSSSRIHRSLTGG